jgi:hypothetical protein
MSGRLYRLRVPPQVVTIIRTLHPQIKRKVRTALTWIRANGNRIPGRHSRTISRAFGVSE